MTLPDRFTDVPAQIIAGDTVPLTLSFSAADAADGGALTFALAGAVVITPVVGVANGSAWNVTLPSTLTAALLPGSYAWRTRLVQDGETRTLSTGTTTVTADLATLGAGDALSWEEKALRAVETALTGTIEGEMKMFMIGGRQVQTFSLKELMTLRSQLKAAVAAQRGRAFGRVSVTFAR